MATTLTPDPVLIVKSLVVRPVEREQAARYQAQMARHHYLGALPKIGETIWYVATWQGQWLAQIGFSAAALKCGARDRWIGWDFRTQYDRLRSIANNSRFLILPEGRLPNLGSRVLALVARRIGRDWQARFGHPLFLIETFVDPSRFHGGVYRAANWLELGLTQGYRRTRAGYSPDAEQPKWVFVFPLVHHARACLTHPDRTLLNLTGIPRLMLNSEQMHALPHCFKEITDPRRVQGRRHPLPVVLALAAGAILCGMRGYKAIHQWAETGPGGPRPFLLPQDRWPLCRSQRIRHSRLPGTHRPRGARCRAQCLESRLGRLGQGLGPGWQNHATGGRRDRRADPHPERGRARLDGLPHPKKVGTLPVVGGEEAKRTNEIGMAIPVLKACAIAGRDITADALHTQRALAAFLVQEGAHYHFTAKGNQPKLEQAIALLFAQRQVADFSATDFGHGRIETRRIWCSTQRNGYLDFPHVAQVFLIEREVVEKKTGKTSCEIALGLTSRPPERGLARTPAGHPSRPLADRSHAFPARLELRRGSLPHSDRLRP